MLVPVSVLQPWWHSSYLFFMANHHDLTPLCYRLLFLFPPWTKTTPSMCKALRTFFMSIHFLLESTPLPMQPITWLAAIHLLPQDWSLSFPCPLPSSLQSLLVRQTLFDALSRLLFSDTHHSWLPYQIIGSDRWCFSLCRAYQSLSI